MWDEYPETRFVRTGGVHIAYQVLGDGPGAIVFASEWWLHLDAQWDDPAVARFLERLASFGRLVVFDRRGFGLSDPLPTVAPPTVEETMCDMLAVMDEAGVERATVVAAGDAAPPALLMAAAHPERVDALVLFNGFARLSWAPDYRDGVPIDVQRAVLRDVEERWGTEHPFGTVAPSTIGDVGFQKWFTRATRQSVSRAAAIALTKLDYETDVSRGSRQRACTDECPPPKTRPVRRYPTRPVCRVSHPPRFIPRTRRCGSSLVVRRRRRRTRHDRADGHR